MTTLLEVRKGDGTLVGRCDERCYNAAERDCHCICGGKNHGVGKVIATDNTRESYTKWLEAYADQEGLDDNYDVLIGEPVIDAIVKGTGFDMSNIISLFGEGHESHHR